MYKKLLAIVAVILAVPAIAFAGSMLSPGVVTNNSVSPTGAINVVSNFTYGYVSTNNSTTSFKSAPGVLHALTIDTPVASSIITVFDSTSTATGTVIAKITLPATLLQQGPYTALLDVAYLNGLTVQQTGATSTLTISFE